MPLKARSVVAVPHIPIGRGGRGGAVAGTGAAAGGGGVLCVCVCGCWVVFWGG